MCVGVCVVCVRVCVFVWLVYIGAKSTIIRIICSGEYVETIVDYGGRVEDLVLNSLSTGVLVWYPAPSVQAHARIRITACACGKEGSGEMDGLRTGKSWNVKTVLECN